MPAATPFWPLSLLLYCSSSCVSVPTSAINPRLHPCRVSNQYGVAAHWPSVTFFLKHFCVDLEAVDFKTSLVYRREEELFHARSQCHTSLSQSDICGPVRAERSGDMFMSGVLFELANTVQLSYCTLHSLLVKTRKISTFLCVEVVSLSRLTDSHLCQICVWHGAHS